DSSCARPPGKWWYTDPRGAPLTARTRSIVVPATPCSRNRTAAVRTIFSRVDPRLRRSVTGEDFSAVDMPYILRIMLYAIELVSGDRRRHPARGLGGNHGTEQGCHSRSAPSSGPCHRL